MVEVITLEMLLNLPKELLKKSEEYDEYAVLLDKLECSKYDYKVLKENVSKYFNYFKKIRYIYQFPSNYEITMSVNYDRQKTSSTNLNFDPISNFVTKKIDKEIEITTWASNFYHIILIVASKLTLQEATYLVDSFFSNYSEELICEKIGMCRNTLQKVKKSCLIKSWIELQKLKLPEDV